MRRRIPSSLTLTVFESAVRHGSFTQAAQDLSLTQSAICRQIATLEQYLGVALFRRSGRGVAPTQVALDYAARVAASLDSIERDTAELIAHGEGVRELTIATLPTFASQWLIPRLPNFYAAQPQVTVNLLTRTRPFLFEETRVDAAIFARNADWPATEQTFLMDEDLVAVCAPSLIAPRKRLKASDFEQHRLLHLDTRPQAWREWFDALGLRVANDRLGPRLDSFAYMAQCAIHGLGIALVPRFLVTRELAGGELVESALEKQSAARAPGPRNSTAYYLIRPELRKPNPVLDAFRDWLLAECAGK
ncbi:LysR substrate-binding domain-containing protein [Ramlibacter sp.]|uniref:LysR substrate-binding domain-containing protein n=1 Tax=Ramlibacter sp. TaxID=1917967 RepID=UPI003D12DA30